VEAVRLKKPSGVLSKPFFDKGELRKSVNGRLLKFDIPLQIIEPGVRVGPKKQSKGLIAERFTNKLYGGDTGLHLVVRDAHNRTLHGRHVETDPTPANTSGSPGVDLLVGFFYQTFPNQWESWGNYVYKHISGSSTWSDHAYVNPNANPSWCGRALDVHPHTVAIGDAMLAAALNEPAIKAKLRYVLWRGVPDLCPGHQHWSFEDGGYPGGCN